MNRAKTIGANAAIRPSEISLNLVLALMTGILLAEIAPPLPVLLGAMACAGGGLLLRRFFAPAALYITILLGVALAGYGLAHFGRDAAPQFDTQGEITTTGTVAMAEAMSRNRQRIRFAPDNSAAGDWRLITRAGAPHLVPGDRVELATTLNHPLPQLLPGGFDFTRNAANKGFSGNGFVEGVTVIGKGEAGFTARIRGAIQQRIITALPEREAAVASALLVGLRGLITPDLRESFRASGLAHLLAISGLHMALFCGSVLFIIRLGLACFPQFSSRYPALKIAALTSLPFGLFYLLVAGMPVSAIRAFGMVCFVILAISIDRRGMTLHHVALMALVILLFDPASLYDPAFQMSFAAVFGLVASWMLRQQYRLRHAAPPGGIIMRFGRYALEIMAASLIASTASAPFVIYHFGVTTAWSVLANLIGIPLMGFIIMPAGVLALLLMPIGFEGGGFFVMERGLGLLTAWAEFVATLPLSHLSVPPPPAIALVLLTFGAVLPFAMSQAVWWRIKVFAVVLPVFTGFIIWTLAPVPVFAVTEIRDRIHAIVMDAEGRAVISRKNTNDFSRSIMLRPFGRSEAVYANDAPGAECAAGYCVIESRSGDGDGGGKIAIVWRRFALSDICPRRDVDVVITYQDALYPCGEGIIIGPAELQTRGGVMGYFDDDDGWRLEWVKEAD